jgi:hypothetical protein
VIVLTTKHGEIVCTYTLGGSNQVLEKLQDHLLFVAFSERFHGGRYQIELLLQVIEANLSVYAIPVEHAVLHYVRPD